MGVGPQKHSDMIDNMFNLASKKILKGHFGGRKRSFKRKVWAKGNDM